MSTQFPDFLDTAPEKVWAYLFDRLPVGTAVIDRDFRLRRCNPTWAEFIGRYTPSAAADAVPGVSLFDLEPGTEAILRPLFAPVFAGETVRQEGLRLESGGIVSYWDVVLVPLAVDGEVVAVLDVSLDATNHVLNRQALAQINQTLEQQVAERTQEIEQRHLESERRRQVAEALRDIVRVLNSSRPLPQILNYIAAQAAGLMDATICTLHHIDYRQAFVHIEASYGLPETVRDITGFPLLSSKADERILNRQPVTIPHQTLPPLDPVTADGLDPRVRRWRVALAAAYPAYLAVPLVVADEVYGSLAFYFTEQRPFSPETIDLAQSLSDQAALAIANAHLRLQAGQAAVVEERNRLARDLHDAVTQTLFSASLIADVLPRIWERNPEAALVRLAELRELTRGALAEMRTLLLELRPATLTETTLPDLLKQLTEAAIGRSRLAVDLVVTGERPLPPDVQVAFYRIAQEALNNISKHAAASQVSLRLTLAPDNVTLVVADNGRGFDPRLIGTNSLGLGIMRERAEKINAQLTIDSQIGVGATIMVACALAEEAEDE
ncbi:MAG: GAF domain-containing protein [Anaerolinea sp.]|nr:GAF domain-containing protein [Anaerolinea sp.]